MEVKDYNNCPGDDRYKAQYEELFNTPGVDSLQDCSTEVCIPVLDDNIAVDDVHMQIIRSNEARTCGPDGGAKSVANTVDFRSICFFHTVVTMARLVNIFRHGRRQRVRAGKNR